MCTFVLAVFAPQGTHGFTLDPLLGEFMLTHPNISIPKRGQIYSVNDARYFDCESLSSCSALRSANSMAHCKLCWQLLGWPVDCRATPARTAIHAG